MPISYSLLSQIYKLFYLAKTEDSKLRVSNESPKEDIRRKVKYGMNGMVGTG